MGIDLKRLEIKAEMANYGEEVPILQEELQEMVRMIKDLQYKLQEAVGAKDRYIQLGFDTAVDNAEVSENDGWSRCAPHVAWGVAYRELAKLLEPGPLKEFAEASTSD